MKFHGIVFDMDGTIVDTTSIWDGVTVRYLEHKGITLTEADRAAISEHASTAHLFHNATALKMLFALEDDAQTLAHEIVELANKGYEKGISFIDGFEQFHAKATQHNLKMALATNALDSTLHITNQALQLNRFFGDHLYNITHVNYRSKPNPDVYLHACKQLGIEPAQAVAIEDSSTGVRAAKAAGMFCIGINTAKKPSMLKDADMIIDHYDHIDLVELLGLAEAK